MVLDLKDGIIFIGSLWPTFIILFLIISSIFNGTGLKGFLFLIAVVIISALWWVIWGGYLTPRFSRMQSEMSPLCLLSTFNFWDRYLGNFQPCLSCILVWFTNTYLFVSMLELLGANKLNIYLIVVFGLGTVAHIIALSRSNYERGPSRLCFSTGGILLVNYIFAMLIGIGFGIAVFQFFWALKAKNLLFFEELYPNSEFCSLKKTTYQCNAYVNGSLITDSVV